MSAFAFFEQETNKNKTSLDVVLERLFDNLPNKPYCADGFDWGNMLKIRNKKEAITKPYIQFNHPMWKKYIVIDIDNTGAVADWIYDYSYLPQPNLIIENKKNGRAHFVYELLDAVSFTNNSSIKAQRYYTAIQNALTDEFKADHRFTGLVSKNPFSSKWRVSCFREDAYQLKELANKLDLQTAYSLTDSKAKENLKSANDEDLVCGRNDQVFHASRKLAYKDINEFKDKAGLLFDNWLSHVLDIVKHQNSVFTNPMDYKECFNIAKSISKFCWKNHDECVKKFSQLQAARGSLGGKKRSLMYETVRTKAKQLFRRGMATKDIADKLEISARSVQRYTRGLQKIKLLSIKDINLMRKKALKFKRQCPNQVLAASRGCLTFKGHFEYVSNVSSCAFNKVFLSPIGSNNKHYVSNKTIDSS